VLKENGARVLKGAAGLGGGGGGGGGKGGGGGRVTWCAVLCFRLGGGRYLASTTCLGMRKITEEEGKKESELVKLKISEEGVTRVNVDKDAAFA